jgi:rhamnose transport system ATP-binding protein
LDVHEGEVVGITGITGSGKEQLAEVLYGARRPTHGSVEVLGRPVRLTPRRAASAGVAGVPGDRAREGVIAALPVSANLVLPSLPQVSRAGFLRRVAVRDLVARRVAQLAIKVRSGRVLVAQLSGGNQQKVALGKWLERVPRVLVLVEPTQGIDIKVRYELYRLIRALAAEGRAVVLVSSDLPEVLTVADRIVVLRSGSVVGELDAAKATSEAVVGLSFGRPSSPTPARNP